MTTPTTTPRPAHPQLADAGAAAARYVAAATSDNTRRGYQSDWRTFVAWCERCDVEALPAAPETVALYLGARAELEGAASATIRRALAAITKAHRVAGHPSPRDAEVVRGVLRGIGRTHGTAQTGVDPVCVDELRAMVSALGVDTLAGLRDRALLVLGFAGAFRRGEIVALEVADLTFCEDGLTVAIRRSKVDQEGEGAAVGLPYGSNPDTCPVRTVRRWLAAAGLESGALFRSVDRHGNVRAGAMAGRSVALIIKRAAEGAGLDPAGYSGHSLRAGLATSAARAGKSERTIMRQGRWRSVTTARRYIRDADLYRDNAASGIGL